MSLRMTPQTKLVLSTAKKLGHASNADILKVVRHNMPDISATTVHRITTRLIINNMLSYGPEVGGSMIIDANTEVHDHFLCKACDGIKDIKIKGEAREAIEDQVPNLALSTSLTITGDCTICK